MSLRISQKLDKTNEGCARVIMAKCYLNIEYPPFVKAAFGPGNASPPKEGIVMGNGSNRYTTEVFLAEV
jgi:hypothetical protein